MPTNKNDAAKAWLKVFTHACNDVKQYQSAFSFSKEPSGLLTPGPCGLPGRGKVTSLFCLALGAFSSCSAMQCAE